MMAIGVYWLFNASLVSLLIAPALALCFLAIIVYISSKRLSRKFKAIDHLLNVKLGRVFIVSFLFGLLFSLLIGFAAGGFESSVNSHSIALIMASIVSFFVTYTQIATLKATGLYRDDVDPKILEVIG